MIGMVRDTWRAILVVIVVCLLRDVFAERQAAAPAVTTQITPPPAWQPMPQPVFVQPEPPRPLRRVGGAFVELADSVIGVFRR